MALEVAVTDSRAAETPKLSLDLEVDPRTVAYCIGRGKSNLREIGHQVMTQTGSKVFIKYQKPHHSNWGHFSINSHNAEAIETARDLLRESETKFLENKLDSRIHPVETNFNPKIGKDFITKKPGKLFRNHQSPHNQPRSHHQRHHHQQHQHDQHDHQHYQHQVQHRHVQHGGRGGGRAQNRERKSGRQPVEHFHRREFNGARRLEELPTHFAWAD